jgi:hypothetical protein
MKFKLLLKAPTSKISIQAEVNSSQSYPTLNIFLSEFKKKKQKHLNISAQKQRMELDLPKSWIRKTEHGQKTIIAKLNKRIWTK